MKKILLIITTLTIFIACQTDNQNGNGSGGNNGGGTGNPCDEGETDANGNPCDGTGGGDGGTGGGDGGTGGDGDGGTGGDGDGGTGGGDGSTGGNICDDSNNNGTTENNSSVWDGKTMTKPTIANNYYVIQSPANLAWLACNDITPNKNLKANNINIKFASDIDMGNKPFIGIKKFQGVFDGDNRSVTNLNIHDPKDNNTIALIREITGDTTIKYLTLASGRSNGKNNVAGFVGKITGTASNKIKVTIDNSTNNLNISVNNTNTSTPTGFDNLSGFIANADYAVVRITRSANLNNITTVTNSTSRAGGIIGAVQNSEVNIYNVINTGEVLVTNSNSSTGSSAGGIAGYINNGADKVFATIHESYSTGNITNQKGSAGGIIGYIRRSDDTINNENNMITYNYNTGDITGYTSGGIIGTTDGGNALIGHSLSYSNVIGTKKGAIIGENIEPFGNAYDNSFWHATDPTNVPIQDDTGGGLTEKELTNRNTFVGWNIGNNGSKWEILNNAIHPTLINTPAIH